MKNNDFIKSVSIMTALAISTSVFAAEIPPPGSLTPAGTQLEAHYSKMLADLKEAIKALEPKVDEKKKAEFTKRVAALDQIELTDAQKTIVTGADGVITIPSAAAASTVNTDKLRFMHTIDGNEVQVHYALGSAQPEMLNYSVDAPADGKYELTGNSN